MVIFKGRGVPALWWWLLWCHKFHSLQKSWIKATDILRRQCWAKTKPLVSFSLCSTAFLNNFSISVTFSLFLFSDVLASSFWSTRFVFVLLFWTCQLRFCSTFWYQTCVFLQSAVMVCLALMLAVVTTAAVYGRPSLPPLPMKGELVVLLCAYFAFFGENQQKKLHVLYYSSSP